MATPLGAQGPLIGPRRFQRGPTARVCVHANQAPKPYQSPKPYSAPGATNVRTSPRATPEVRSSRRALPDFWQYKAPHTYGSPANYISPAGYRAPMAYGPGQSGGGGPQGPPGGSGGGGGPGDSGNSGGGSFPRTLTFLFALLVAVGGVMAWKKKGSSASLKASSAISATLLVAAALMTGPYHTAGLGIALGANLALAAYMGRGFVRTRKPFPQGVLTAFSVINSLVYIKSITNL